MSRRLQPAASTVNADNSPSPTLVAWQNSEKLLALHGPRLSTSGGGKGCSTGRTGKNSALLIQKRVKSARGSGGADGWQWGVTPPCQKRLSSGLLFRCLPTLLGPQPCQTLSGGGGPRWCAACCLLRLLRAALHAAPKEMGSGCHQGGLGTYWAAMCRTCARRRRRSRPTLPRGRACSQDRAQDN